MTATARRFVAPLLLALAFGCAPEPTVVVGHVEGLEREIVAMEKAGNPLDRLTLESRRKEVKRLREGGETYRRIMEARSPEELEARRALDTFAATPAGKVAMEDLIRRRASRP